jgi:citrate synthase
MTEKEREFIQANSASVQQSPSFNEENFLKYSVKRGLRNADGSGVLVGLTEIGDVHGYVVDENEVVPDKGRLRYRGIRINDLVESFQSEDRFGFEETAFLLLFGKLPNADELAEFNEILGAYRRLPSQFIEDMMLKAPSPNIMNKLARSVLAFYSYDEKPEDRTIAKIYSRMLQLIAAFPSMVAYGFQAKRHYYDRESLYIHAPDANLSTAENFLSLIRPAQKYTKLEAELLDLCLVLHAEHGGGNNSAFTIHVVSSADTDSYSAVSAAIGSLKGSRHGGANIKVMHMMDDLKTHIDRWDDDEQVAAYLGKILKKEAFDRTGLIYGIGHAVYTESDPRAVLLRSRGESLAREKGFTEEFDLYTRVERLAPEVIYASKGRGKVVSANVDFYSGFVYKMLGIPEELFTPIFALGRIAGWAAHRMEEVIHGGRIVRPAFKNVVEPRSYVPIENR